MSLLRLLLSAVICLSVGSLALADEGPEKTSDPPPAGKMVDLEFILIETDPSLQYDEQPPWDLSLPAEKLRELALMPAHAERGVVSVIRLAALENTPASVQVGQQKSVVVGTTMASGRSGLTRTVRSERQMGTLVEATVRVEDDRVIVECQIEKSRDVQPNAASVEEMNAAPAGLSTTTCRTTVEAPSGRAILLGAMVTTSREGVGRMIALLTASIVTDPKNTD